MASTHGTLTTALTGTNNDLDFTARHPGASSARLKVKYTDPAAASATESVSVSFDETTKVTTIDVSLATNGGSTITSTGDTIKATIAADPEANALVTVADTGGNDGSGVVTALAATALSAGSPDATTGGYDDDDEMEDDGWKLSNATSANGDVQYRAEILVDGEVIVQAAGTSAGRQKATWKYKEAFLAVASPLRLNGAGTRD